MSVTNKVYDILECANLLSSSF